MQICLLLMMHWFDITFKTRRLQAILYRIELNSLEIKDKLSVYVVQNCGFNFLFSLPFVSRRDSTDWKGLIYSFLVRFSHPIRVTLDQNGFRARSGTVFPGVATKLLPHGTLRSERERLNYGVSQKKGCGGRGRRSNQDRFRNIRRGWRSANFRPVKASRRVASRRIRLRYVRVQRRVTNWGDATVWRVFDRLFCRYLVTFLFSRIRETFCYSTACY